MFNTFKIPFPKTTSSPLKIDAWEMNISFAGQKAYCQGQYYKYGYVSFRESI